MQTSDKLAARRQFGMAVLQGILAGLLLGAAFAGGYFYHDFATNRTASTTDYGLLQEAEGLLAGHYLYDMPPSEELVHSAAAGMVASLEDPYTYFVEPQTAEIDHNNLAGSFGGIGAEIAVDEQGRYVIARIYLDNPAHAAGVQEGDVIAAVDGREVAATTTDMNALLSLVRGEVGDPVVLTLQRGDEIFDVEIIRAELLIPSTFWRVLEEDQRVGYIQVTRFTTRSPEEVREALAELREQNVDAYILDLRNNGGGLVDAAVGVAGEFLNGGVVLYEQRQGDAERVFNASRGGAALEEPLAILVNNGTASAAEIVAGALQERDRATLVGEQTFGKGSVQLILPLSDASSLHVTTAEWYTPERYRIQGQGLAPDVEVTGDEDGQATLAAAVELLTLALPVAEAESQ